MARTEKVELTALCLVQSEDAYLLLTGNVRRSFK